MLKSRNHPKWLSILLLLITVIAAPLLLANCGSSGGGDGGGSSASIMASPATVDDWVTDGYGTDKNGYSKMVVLSVDSDANYTAGHVPGAYLLDTTVDLSATRNNGVSDTVSQVATRTQMDDLIQKYGIDADTVVVFTGGGDGSASASMTSIGRAYFNFRFWGFPRVMNGDMKTYVADGGTLQTSTPTLPTASTYSVCELTPNTSVRASLEEMIDVAEDADATTIVLDVRSIGEYNGTAG